MATKNEKATAQPQAAAQPQQAQAGTQTPQVDPTALSIGDLKNLSVILDVASTRGAFKAAEMANVGFIYNKLQAFLARVAPTENQPGNAPMPAPATAPTIAEQK